jgi:RimJ/RimL family protein N-acetyltransferase
MPIVLEGRLVRLEPLGLDHLAGLLDAASESRDTYGFAMVPDGEAAMRRYIEEAVAERQGGDHLPFATRRLSDSRVVGTTRFRDLTPWTWPPGHPQQRVDRPDAPEIGYTWLAASAQRSGVNTEAKFLMLRHAFEVWDTHAVRLRTDRRNRRSWAAIERLGASFEGVRRADRPGADGTVRDSAFFSITGDEWPAVRIRLEALLGR